jgi:hypothetical protein
MNVERHGRMQFEDVVQEILDLDLDRDGQGGHCEKTPGEYLLQPLHARS